MADPIVPDTGSEGDLEQAREIDSDNWESYLTRSWKGKNPLKQTLIFLA